MVAQTCAPRIVLFSWLLLCSPKDHNLLPEIDLKIDKCFLHSSSGQAQRYLCKSEPMIFFIVWFQLRYIKVD